MTTATATEPTPREKILAVAQELGLTMDARFVPFSQSRNRDEKNPTLNWRVTLSRKGVYNHAILTTDYSAGCAHAPSYKQSHFGGANYLQNEAVKWECENGRPARVLPSTDIVPLSGGKPLKPDFADVLYSLAMDADVIDHSSFESWASDFGYDVDSRKAESIYRACLDTALKLRNALGENGLAQLREACQDY